MKEEWSTQISVNYGSDVLFKIHDGNIGCRGSGLVKSRTPLKREAICSRTIVLHLCYTPHKFINIITKKYVRINISMIS